MASTRMKDFYDLWILAGQLAFEGPALRQALKATFRRRRTAVPAGPPTALTAEFHGDRGKQAQWTAFLSRTGLTAPGLPQVTGCLRAFPLPPAAAIIRQEPFDHAWPAGGPWQPPAT